MRDLSQIPQVGRHGSVPQETDIHSSSSSFGIGNELAYAEEAIPDAKVTMIEALMYYHGISRSTIMAIADGQNCEELLDQLTYRIPYHTDIVPPTTHDILHYLRQRIHKGKEFIKEYKKASDRRYGIHIGQGQKEDAQNFLSLSTSNTWVRAPRKPLKLSNEEDLLKRLMGSGYDIDRLRQDPDPRYVAEAVLPLFEGPRYGFSQPNIGFARRFLIGSLGRSSLFTDRIIDMREEALKDVRIKKARGEIHLHSAPRSASGSRQGRDREAYQLINPAATTQEGAGEYSTPITSDTMQGSDLGGLHDYLEPGNSSNYSLMRTEDEWQSKHAAPTYFNFMGGSSHSHNEDYLSQEYHDGQHHGYTEPNTWGQQKVDQVPRSPKRRRSSKRSASQIVSTESAQPYPNASSHVHYQTPFDVYAQYPQAFPQYFMRASPFQQNHPPYGHSDMAEQ